MVCDVCGKGGDLRLWPLTGVFGHYACAVFRCLMRTSKP